MLTHAWLIPAIPALSFVLILFFGKKLPRGGSEIGIAAVAIAFVLVDHRRRRLDPADQRPADRGRSHAPRRSPSTAPTRRGARPTSRGRDRLGQQRAGGPFAYGIPGTTDGTVAATAAAESHGEESTEPTATEGEAHGEESTEPAATEGEAQGEEAAAEGEEAEEEHHVVDPVVRQVTWFENGGVTFTVGTLVDGLSAVLMIVVTIVSLLVHVYSTDYVNGDRRYTHFFAFLSLFTASMLFFVLSESTLQMIVGWELVGVCSFVLIGHWWEEKPNSDAALKAFLTNRVGDVGLLVGMITLFFAAGGSFSILRIDEMADAGEIRHVLLLVGVVLPHGRASCPSPASSCCTRGCPTPWPARRRSPP